MIVLAADVGGTRMRAGIVTVDGVVVDRTSVPTSTVADGMTALGQLVADLVRPDRLERHGIDAPAMAQAPLVAGLPGRIDHHLGRLETAANLPASWLPSFDERSMSAHLGRPCHLANDADLAAVGEVWFGAATDLSDVVYVTLSTGVGAGIVLGRSLVHGRRSGGEIGHTLIDADASSGSPLTVEDLGSGTALGRAAHARGLPGGADLVDRVRAGDVDAAAVWTQTLDAAAIGIVNLAWIVSPEAVVIGGGLGRNGDLVLDPVRRALAALGPPSLDIEVREAALGDDAGLVGAAGWAAARGIPWS